MSKNQLWLFGTGPQMAVTPVRNQGAMSLMFDALSHGISRKRLVHRHRQLVAFEQQQLVDFLRVMSNSYRL